jgi:hypothetical protein
VSKIWAFHSFSFLIFASSFSYCQTDAPPASVFHPNQQVRISELHLRTAESTGSISILVAALETIFHNPEVCCGDNSALQDKLLSADTPSLKQLSIKLAGRYVLNDGRSIVIEASYLPRESISPDRIIAPLMDKQPLLMEWNSRLFVVSGVVFDETVYYSGNRDYVIHKLLLLDPRSSSPHRETIFDREKDDWTKVQGFLMLAAARRQ